MDFSGSYRSKVWRVCSPRRRAPGARCSTGSWVQAARRCSAKDTALRWAERLIPAQRSPGKLRKQRTINRVPKPGPQRVLLKWGRRRGGLPCLPKVIRTQRVWFQEKGFFRGHKKVCSRNHPEPSAPPLWMDKPLVWVFLITWDWKWNKPVKNNRAEFDAAKAVKSLAVTVLSTERSTSAPSSQVSSGLGSAWSVDFGIEERERVKRAFRTSVWCWQRFF